MMKSDTTSANSAQWGDLRLIIVSALCTYTFSSAQDTYQATQTFFSGLGYSLLFTTKGRMPCS